MRNRPWILVHHLSRPINAQWCILFTLYIIYFAIFFPFLAHCEKVAFLRTYELHLLQNAHTTCTCFASFRIFEVGIFKNLKIDRDILKFTSCCFHWGIKCSLLWPQICMNEYSIWIIQIGITILPSKNGKLYLERYLFSYHLVFALLFYLQWIVG